MSSSKQIESTTWSVVEILSMARTGELCVPKYPNGFVWSGYDVECLFDSVYQGYPIGQMLIWDRDGMDGTEPIWSGSDTRGPETRGLIVIDGRHRLISLVQGLLGPESDPRLCLYFDPDECRFRQIGRCETPTKTWLPLPEVTDTQRFSDWMQERQLHSDQCRRITDMIHTVLAYKVPVYIIRTDDIAEVEEIYTRMNIPDNWRCIEKVASTSARDGYNIGAC